MMADFLNNITCDKKAEEVIKSLNKNKYDDIALSYSQLRNLYELVTNLYNKIQYTKTDTLSDDQIADIGYTRAKFAYASGRDIIVKDFVKKAFIMEYLEYIRENPTTTNLKLFCKYMECLVAFHKFYKKTAD